MKNHAIIIHGLGADSTSNWFPWLRDELTAQNWNVDIPDFPRTEWPSLDEWLIHFERIVLPKMIQNDTETVLMGHSLGVPFILRVIEHLKTMGQKEGRVELKGIVLVAGFADPIGHEAVDTFVQDDFDWKTIQSTCRTIYVINSDNDPVIPQEFGQSLADNLGVQPIIEHNGLHLTNPGGPLEYPRVRDLVLNL